MTIRSAQRWRVFGLVVSHLPFGFAGLVFPEYEIDDRYWLLIGIIPLFFAWRWCLLDARARNYPMSTALKWALVWCFGFAFPYYVFRSRGVAGWRTIGWSALVFLGCFAICSLGGLLAILIFRIDFR